MVTIKVELQGELSEILPILIEAARVAAEGIKPDPNPSKPRIARPDPLQDPELLEEKELAGIPTMRDELIQRNRLKETPLTHWDKDEVSDVYDGLTIRCKEIITEIASDIEGYSFYDLLSKFNLQSGKALGGILASLGHQIKNKDYNDYVYPLTWVNIPGKNRCYKFVDPAWSDFLTA